MNPPSRNSFHVRLAHPTEIAAAGTVVVDAFDHHGYADDEYRLVLADAATRSRDAQVVVAASEDGTILGSVTFALPGSPWAPMARPGEAEFRMLGVSPLARGRGVGTALVSWCIARAGEVGAHRIVISSLPEMADAHRMYYRHGFVRRPERDWSPTPTVDVWAFTLDLGAITRL